MTPYLGSITITDVLLLVATEVESAPTTWRVSALQTKPADDFLSRRARAVVHAGCPRTRHRRIFAHVDYQYVSALQAEPKLA